MKKEFDLQKFKKENGIKDPIIGEDYEIYKSYFPNLDKEEFVVLERNGMLGRLYRGQRIDLIKENIHIPFCWWRYQIFKSTNQHVPCVKREDNRYWNGKSV
jgi:hypothetical protein